jgi:gas vesicle protein
METKKLIGGLLAGVAIGVAVGMLLAPRSGKRTLQTMAKGSKRLASGLKTSVNDSIESLKAQYNSGVDASAKRGREAIASASERIKI